MFKEFKKFIARGNVLDLAVGVVIGASFGKITTSLTESIIMPTMGWLFGDIDFSNYFLRLGTIPEGYSGSRTNYAELKEAGVAMIGYGDFVTQVINFLLLALALFLLVRTANRVLDAMEEEKKAQDNSSDNPDIPTDPQLDVLRDIRAELREMRGIAPA